MKKILKLFLVLMAFGFVFTSCESNEDVLPVEEQNQLRKMTEADFMERYKGHIKYTTINHPDGRSTTAPYVKCSFKSY